MRTKAEIKAKIEELEEAIVEVEAEFRKALSDDDVDEFSQESEELDLEFETKKEEIEKRIELLEWILD